MGLVPKDRLVTIASPRGTRSATPTRQAVSVEEARMIRSLDSVEIERVLRAEVVGRIGCHAGGRTYVVPVSYPYEAGAIYTHSRDGLKVQMMRQNSAVCFEVDHVEDLVNWHSAICWGTYGELRGAEANYGLDLLRDRLAERLPRELLHGVLAAEETTDGYAIPVVFRINLAETTGREERLHWELLPKSQLPKKESAEASA